MVVVLLWARCPRGKPSEEGWDEGVAWEAGAEGLNGFVYKAWSSWECFTREGNRNESPGLSEKARESLEK